MRSRRQLSASITLLSFNETNLPIKRLVLCGISRSFFLFLEYKNVKIVDFTKDRSNYHLRAEFRAFEWEERYKFRGLLYKFEERSILSRSFTVEKARVEPTSYKIRARWEPRSEKGCLGLLNGEFRSGTGCHPRLGFTIPQVASRQDDKKRYSLRSMDNFSLRLCFHSSII